MLKANSLGNSKQVEPSFLTVTLHHLVYDLGPPMITWNLLSKLSIANCS